MKRKLLTITLLLGVLLLCNRFSYGQFFPGTMQHSPCTSCVPSAGYSVISGFPSVSNRNFQGGQNPWKSPQGSTIELSQSPSVTDGQQTNYVGTNTFGTFLTLQSGPAGKDKVKFVVSGFIPGVQYTMEYGVISTRTQLSSFGSSATMDIGSVEQNPILLTKSQVNFDANSYNKWQLRYVQFTPTTTQVSFTLYGNTDVGTGFVNFDIWDKPLHCILPPDKQVELNTSSVSTKYPCKSISEEKFTSAVKTPLPTGASVVWKVSDIMSASNLKFLNQEHGPGDYYSFYFHQANVCYSLEASNLQSTAKLEIVYVPTQVPLNLGNSITVHCPESNYNLNKKVQPNAFAGDPNEEILWFSNNSHQGSPISNGIVSTPGTYYAFYYDSETNCFSVPTSTSAVTVKFDSPCCKAGTAQVVVQPNLITNTCPILTADLTKTVTSNVPPNTQVVWFNNPTHTAPKVNDPTAVGAGTYYAFIYDQALDCYNTGNSTAQVKVTQNLCATNVQLNLKAGLQGAMSGAGAKMRNDLQTYGGTGLLPTSAPYGMSSSYPSINNPAGAVGEVVDWVLVEVRSASSPQTVLQSAALLLKPDGSIVNRNGLAPTFNNQAGAVRLVVKHRNHLAIMSNPIQSFSSGTVSYDFTTGVSQAANVLGDPVQMIQKNGVWCMQSGDLNSNQDMVVDGSDGAYFKSQFKAGLFDTYNPADTNMDGIVDGLDGSLFKTNFLLGLYSTIINY